MEKKLTSDEIMGFKEDYINFVRGADLNDPLTRNYANYLRSLFERE